MTLAQEVPVRMAHVTLQKNALPEVGPVMVPVPVDMEFVVLVNIK